VGVLTGRVVGTGGEPVVGALAWLEDTDLSGPVNNVAAYEARRADTLGTTDADGWFEIPLDGADAAWVTVHALGHRPVRHVPYADGDVAPLEIVLPRSTGLMVIAHRGASESAPENTLAAYRKAMLMGVDVMEADVQLTADNQVVIMHDLTVDRTTPASGHVRAATLAQLTQLDAGAWFVQGDFAGERVPSLRQLLELVAGSHVRLALDIKAQGGLHEATVDAVVDLVEEYGMAGRVIIFAFDRGAVQRCVEKGGYYCVYMSGTIRTEEEVLLEAQELGAPGVRVVAARFNEPFAARLMALGHDVFLGAANDPGSWASGLDVGVYAIGTDRPAAVLEFLADRALQAGPETT
jgi:glycerophosphoryl diester phosphodiesterase